MFFDQPGHDPVTHPARAPAQNDRDDVPAVPLDRGQQIEARGAGVAGLDPVHALDAAEQVIVVAHRRAAIPELMRGEIAVIFRKTLLNRPSQDRQIAGGRDLFAVGKSRRVAVDRARHTQSIGLARHHFRECVFISADALGDGDGDVIGRFRHDRLDRMFDADA